jgi:Zn-dependent peptidase ImmA (M78 family)
LSGNQFKPRIGFARNCARAISKKYNVSPPVDVEAIAIEEGYSLEHEPIAVPAQLNRALGVITIKKDDHIHRQRLSLAHELGHHFLNHDLEFHDYPGEPGEFETYRNGQEAEAFEFASELLVPLMVINKQLEGNRNLPEAAQELAKKCLVSEDMVWISLKNHRKIR